MAEESTDGEHFDSDGCAIYDDDYWVVRHGYGQIRVVELEVGDLYQDSAFDGDDDWLEVEDIAIVDDQVHVHSTGYVDPPEEDKEPLVTGANYICIKWTVAQEFEYYGPVDELPIELRNKVLGQPADDDALFHALYDAKDGPGWGDLGQLSDLHDDRVEDVDEVIVETAVA
jgi:hypothetical protein